MVTGERSKKKKERKILLNRSRTYDLPSLAGMLFHGALGEV